ncbi:uroporphyrinogen-III synthase [Rhodoferax sp. GW822-FHT02A01]|uniref:uroporphyrinogen-III synthase n=1 Tax=Rhodoferax sp. GW822-FHT02A01 TaxID=3141537 RepID=UPI00315DB243
MRVIVTRPGPQAGKWVKALRDAGLDALALPLIEIRPAADSQGVVAVWQKVTTFNALMFVSANAVEHFFAVRPQGSAQPDLLPEQRFWATGPGTVAALRAAGIAPQCIDAPDAGASQFDSEALWQVVRQRVQTGWRVLVVRGSTEAEPLDTEDMGKGVGRDWLAQRLVEKGATVDFVVAYERCAPVLKPGAVALVQLAAADRSIWLFSSSEAIANLRAAAAGVNWRAARAVATHPRIAAAAREAGFGVVCESRPEISDLIASIESLA